MGAGWTGVGSFVGIGEETTWGTPVASSVYLEPLEESLSKGLDYIETPSIYNLGLDKDNHFFDGAIKIGGNLVFGTPYESVGFYKMLKAMFGEGSVANANVEVAVAWSHTFTIKDSLPTTKPGLTFEVRRGKDSGNTQSFQHSGCLFNTLELGIGGINEVLKATFGLVGKDVALITATSPTVPTGIAGRKYVGTKSTVSWGGTSKIVSNVSLTLNNNLSSDFYPLGQTTIAQPIRNGNVSVEGSFTILFDTMDEYNNFVTKTDKVLLITCDSGTKIGASATNNYKVEIKCPFGILTGYPVNVNNVGRITVSVPFRGLRSGSTNELEIKFQDGNDGTTI